MKSRDFAYWLQGFFELRGSDQYDGLKADQVKIIRDHLNLVFEHEIDPSMNDPDYQDKIRKSHPAQDRANLIGC